jgi:hypothetical protein
VSRPAVRPTQPPIQKVLRGPLPDLKCGRVVTLTTRPHLVSRSSMTRSYTPLPPGACTAVAAQVYFLLQEFRLNNPWKWQKCRQIKIRTKSWCSWVHIVTRPRSGRPGFDSRQKQRSLSSPQRRNLLWDPPGLLWNGYLGSNPGKGGRSMNLNVLFVEDDDDRYSPGNY